MSELLLATPVRRHDLQYPPMLLSSTELPDRHGKDKDPRYPSPRDLRTYLSYLIDFAWHVGVPIGAAFLLRMRDPNLPSGRFIMICVLGFLALSLLDRVLLQWITRFTVGKGLTGLRMIREDTGGRPTLWMLLKGWLLGILTIISLAG